MRFRWQGTSSTSCLTTREAPGLKRCHFQTNKTYFLSTKFNQNTFLYTQLVLYKVGAELMQEMDIDKDGQVLIFLIFLCQDNVTFLLHIVIMKIHSKTGLPPIFLDSPPNSWLRTQKVSSLPCRAHSVIFHKIYHLTPNKS